MSARIDALVLDGETRAGLAATRSLGRAGHTVALAASDLRASGMRTRYAARRVALPSPLVQRDRAAAALLDAVSELGVDVILTSVDPWLTLLHGLRPELSELGARPAISGEESLGIALSKIRTLERASALGVPTPASVYCGTPAEVIRAVGTVGLPAVIKPETSWRPHGEGGERLGPVLAETDAQVDRYVELLVRPGVRVLVQEYATGVRETHKLFRVEGRVVARAVMRVDRCWPPLGGSSTSRTTIAPPQDSHELAEALVGAVGVEGFSEVEFRRDRDGKPLLMEINARLSQSLELARAAGVDFARLQFDWAHGSRVTPLADARIGVRMNWLAGDARLVGAALIGSAPGQLGRLSTLRDVAGDYLSGARWEGFDLRDPRPMLGAIAFNLTAPVRLAVRRRTS